MSIHKKQLLRKKEHRLVFDMIKNADIVLQIVDARFPNRCRSQVIENFVNKQGIALIIAINKTDLVPSIITKAWKKILSRELPTVHVSTVERHGTKILREQILRYSNRYPTIVNIVGYPNVGKSSIINVLKGRKSAPTSIRAGYTRSLRKVVISPSITMIDTPGITPTEHLSIEERVFLGTISPEDITDPDVALSYIFNQIEKNSTNSYNHMNALENYLGFQIEGLIEEILEKFARKRGLVKKGNTPQIEEAARIMIRDFSRGKIQYFEIPNNIKGQKSLEKDNLKFNKPL